MNKNEAIAQLAELDRRFVAKGEEAQFWDKEYRLAGTGSKYVKASDKPVIESRYQAARNDQNTIWSEMEAIMTKFGIGANDI